MQEHAEDAFVPWRLIMIISNIQPRRSAYGYRVRLASRDRLARVPVSSARQRESCVSKSGVRQETAGAWADALVWLLWPAVAVVSVS